MTLARSFVPVALLLAAACSVNTSNSGSSSGSSADVKASGTLTGGVAGTMTGATVLGVANKSTADKLQITLQASAPTSLTLTSPAQAAVQSASITVNATFTAVPAAGTYTNTSATVNMFAAIMSISEKDNAGAGQLGGGKLDGDGATPMTLTITSIKTTTTTSSADLYEVHGTLDTTLNGSITASNGMTTPEMGVQLHFAF